MPVTSTRTYPGEHHNLHNASVIMHEMRCTIYRCGLKQPGYCNIPVRMEYVMALVTMHYWVYADEKCHNFNIFIQLLAKNAFSLLFLDHSNGDDDIVGSRKSKGRVFSERLYFFSSATKRRLVTPEKHGDPGEMRPLCVQVVVTDDCAQFYERKDCPKISDCIL